MQKRILRVKSVVGANGRVWTALKSRMMIFMCFGKKSQRFELGLYCGCDEYSGMKIEEADDDDDDDYSQSGYARRPYKPSLISA